MRLDSSTKKRHGEEWNPIHPPATAPSIPSLSASTGERARVRCRVLFPFPATVAHIPATRIHLPEIVADSREITPCRSEIAPYIMEIGIYLVEIAFDWSKIASYS